MNVYLCDDSREEDGAPETRGQLRHSVAGGAAGAVAGRIIRTGLVAAFAGGVTLFVARRVRTRGVSGLPKVSGAV